MALKKEHQITVSYLIRLPKWADDNITIDPKGRRDHEQVKLSFTFNNLFRLRHTVVFRDNLATLWKCQ